MPAHIITEPASEPVTLQEAKDHLRLETALDDSTVARLITMARQHIEEVCWRGLVTQTWELVQGSFAGEDTLELGERGRRTGSAFGSYMESPRGNLAAAGFSPWIELPKGNLGTVTSIKYIDENQVEQTLSPSIYTVDTVQVPGRVRLAYGQTWPATLCPRWDAVRIRYTVGWDVVATVWAGPVGLKQAMLLLISQLYEHRSPEVIARGIVQINFSADALMGPYRLNRGL